MIGPLAVELQTLTVQHAINGGPPEQASNDGLSPKMVAENIDRITNILRYAEPRHSRTQGQNEAVIISPACESIQALFPTFEAVVKTYRTNADILERVRGLPYYCSIMAVFKWASQRIEYIISINAL